MSAPTMQTAVVPTITDRELRSAGEAAAGSEVPIYLVKTRSGLQYRTTPDGEGEVLLRIERENRLSAERTLTEVLIRKPNTPGPQALNGQFDALFWSRAAYEKFVLSYYQTLRILSEDGMKALMTAYAGDTVAIAHDLKSKPTIVGSDAALIGNLHIIGKGNVVKPVTALLSVR